MFYTYAHYTVDSNQIFYIGKGSGDRHLSKASRGKDWWRVVNEHDYYSVILAYWYNEDDSYTHEELLVDIFKHQLVNKRPGGRWTNTISDFRTNQFGLANCMKRPEIAKKVSIAKTGRARPDMRSENNPPQQSLSARLSRSKKLTGITRSEQHKINNSIAQKNLPLLQCQFCEKKIKNPGNLTQHIRANHSVAPHSQLLR
jgi:hypothetical protein